MQTVTDTKQQEHIKTAHLLKVGLHCLALLKYLKLEIKYLTTTKNSTILLISILKEEAELTDYLAMTSTISLILRLKF